MHIAKDSKVLLLQNGSLTSTNGKVGHRSNDDLVNYYYVLNFVYIIVASFNNTAPGHNCEKCPFMKEMTNFGQSLEPD